MTPTTTEREVIRLWPKGPPSRIESVGAEIEYRGPIGTAVSSGMIRNVSDPTLTVFRPAAPNGTGVIVCPGGGWKILFWEHEGVAVAEWLAERGYSAFLLKYRVLPTPPATADFDALIAEIVRAEAERTATRQTPPRTLNDVLAGDEAKTARKIAADDGRRAVEIVRSRAREWGVSPDRIGMMGFSVGGCLVTDIAVDPRAAPLAFVAPIYGGDAGRPVPADAPPLFATVGQDDFLLHRVVENLYADWTNAGRPAELHIYRRGGHGFGLMKRGMPVDGWIDCFHEWLTDLTVA